MRFQPPALLRNATTRARRAALAAATMAFASQVAAADLGAACDALNSAALQGMTGTAAQQGAHLANPKTVKLATTDVQPGVFVAGQSAHFSEAFVATVDASAIRTLKTGGAYITSALRKRVDATQACNIVGVIFPETTRDPAVADPAHVTENITFQITVPLDWSARPDRKLIHFGGGMFNGEVHDPGNALQKFNFWAGGQYALADGAALTTSDSGHRGAASDLGFAKVPADGYGVDDQIAVRNYAGEHIKRVRDVTVAVLKRLASAPPARTYFVGISTGGREALKAVSLYGADYIGAISVAPAWDVASGTSTGYKCDGLKTLSLTYLAVSGALPGSTSAEKKSNFCKMVDLAAQPAINLDSFKARGGKLIVLQGTTDTTVPATKTRYYWQRLEEANPSVADFARYYEISGFDHGFGYVPHINLIGAIDRWITSPTATPEAQNLGFVYANGFNLLDMATIFQNGGYAVPPSQGTKPVCQYPKKQSPEINAFNWFYVIYQAGSCV